MLRSIVSIKRADYGNLISTTCTKPTMPLALQPQDRVPDMVPLLRAAGFILGQERLRVRG
jgi:hypothetical protein